MSKKAICFSDSTMAISPGTFVMTPPVLVQTITKTKSISNPILFMLDSSALFTTTITPPSASPFPLTFSLSGSSKIKNARGNYSILDGEYFESGAFKITISAGSYQKAKGSSRI